MKEKKMKFPYAPAALTLVIAIADCKAGKTSNKENTVVSEVKHEVTIGGKDGKESDRLHSRRCQRRRRTLPASLPDLPRSRRPEHGRAFCHKDGPAGG
jgi:hypothetical protein